LKKSEDESVHQMPLADGIGKTLFHHNGYWHCCAMFPDLQQFEQIRHLALADDDILVTSFPKAGSICIREY